MSKKYTIKDSLTTERLAEEMILWEMQNHLNVDLWGVMASKISISFTFPISQDQIEYC